MIRKSLIPLITVMLFAFGSAHAQNENVVIKENVSTVYADVLRVTPVMQTLRATRNEQVCDGNSIELESHGWIATLRNLTNKAVDRVKTSDRVTGKGCRIVEVEREFKRPIAFDVDYMYQGMKFRSRLPEDPGSRLKIRIGVKPIIQ